MTWPCTAPRLELISDTVSQSGWLASRSGGVNALPAARDCSSTGISAQEASALASDCAANNYGACGRADCQRLDMDQLIWHRTRQVALSGLGGRHTPGSIAQPAPVRDPVAQEGKLMQGYSARPTPPA